LACAHDTHDTRHTHDTRELGVSEWSGGRWEERGSGDEGGEG
jgi:hypothetical protein